MLFSFARAYFMVDMEIPSAYVQFLRSLMPRKPRSEIYNALGLQKQGKNLFYRDFLYHLRHSSDKFRIAPGIKGMVMLVFDLPIVPVRLQGHQGLLPAAEGHHARADQGQVPAGQARTTASAAWPTRWNTATSRFPRQRFEDELVAELQALLPEPDRGGRRRCS